MNKNSKITFKVPKKTNQRLIESLDTESDQKQFLQIKLIESFKKPEISKTSMEFSRFWSIKNPESEAAYLKKRQYIKAHNQSTVEYFGFLYIENESELNKLAMRGNLKTGNIQDSKLGSGSMGVSLSQYSDIYHPGDSSHYVPTKGILLIVKYMKGKINYVVYDDNPTEPQPDYDCHILRTYSHLDSNVTTNKAFHSTQVFLYEYSEDLDIIEYPTQLLIIGAAKFNWTKKYIFKSVAESHNNISQAAVKRRLPDSYTAEDAPPRKILCKSLISKLRKINPKNNSVPFMSGRLVLGSSTSAKLAVSVILMTKFKEPIQLNHLITDSWNLTEVIHNQTFFEFIHYMGENNVATVLKVSPEKIVQLPPKFYEGKTVSKTWKAKHMMYLSMVASTVNDRKAITKLIDNLTQTGTVARITSTFLPNVLFFVFPSGKISDNLGIPKEDGAILHVLILFNAHPEMGYTDKFHIEEYLFILQLNAYFSFLEKPNTEIITRDLLKEVVITQSTYQKELYKKLLISRQRNIQTAPSQPTEESDMEIDSEHEQEVRIEEINTPKSAIQLSNGMHQKSPLIPQKPVQPAPGKIIAPLPVIPRRTPDTLPDTISIDSPAINWEQFADPNFVNDFQNPLKNNLKPVFQPPAPVSLAPVHPQLATDLAIVTKPVIQIATSNPQMPSMAIIPVSHTNQQPREPNGHFRLFNRRRNNFVQNNRVRKAGSVSNLELDRNIIFLSVYRG